MRPLAGISEKIYRRPAKGGAANVLYLQAAIEVLPQELDGIADQVHVNFPWGGLLKGIATGEELLVKNLWRLCKPGARLEIVIGIDPKRDQAELTRLGLPDLSAEYLRSQLVPRYGLNGFQMVDYRIVAVADWPEIESSWAKRLRHSRTRGLIYLKATAR